ncbi:unnamed protein product [Acanthosepion pharaonis]|uniref:Uncharacterized protein n=1 Tax=Acanthosepion pharaonis TaxID=158019 RepID=A0A812C8Q2_ACAPH|nr:unnamed protein product [Sepia pharaonis]
MGKKSPKSSSEFSFIKITLRTLLNLILSLSLSLSLFLSLSLSLSLSTSIYLSIYLSIFLSFIFSLKPLFMRTLNDGKLLAKLSCGDVVALEVKYHLRCLQKLYDAERAYLNSLEKAESSDPGKDLYPVAFSELVIYIMDSKVTNTEAAPVVFRLADLASLYKLRLEQLGVDSPNVHSTRLKEQLFARIPEIEAHKKGRDVLIAFKADTGPVLHEASQYSNALHLSKAADILRKEMLQHKTKFSSELKDGFGEEAIPPALLQVLEISGKLGETVIKQYVEEDVVCQPVLRKGLFTTAAVDNIDHNHTATTASTSFHGKSISMFQHPSKENRGEQQVSPEITDSRTRKVPELPEDYTNIAPVYFKKNPTPASVDEVSLPDPSLFQRNIRVEYEWLEKVQRTTDVDDESNITWSAHHTSQKRTSECETSITSLLPLLRDQAHSVATIKHAMKKVREVVAFLNPGQTPVLAADQPLYAMAKEIQWPEEYGEDKFVIMFGELHIEMTALKSIGSMLADSGWTSALVEADVASSRTADSFLLATNVTKTRQAHQVTACSLFQLLKKVYSSYLAEHSDGDEEAFSFVEWCDSRKKESPQSAFWFSILNMELTILTLVRAFREGNFNLYRESLSELIPYLFANNNVNYARWLPIHLRDMISLEKQYPEVVREFHNGNFVFHKIDRNFSAMAIDQAHEQNNAVIKGEGELFV